MSKVRNEVEFRSGYSKQDPESIIKYYNNYIAEIKKEFEDRLCDQQKEMKNTLTWKLGRVFVFPLALVADLVLHPARLVRSKSLSSRELPCKGKSKEQSDPGLLISNKSAEKTIRQPGKKIG